MRFFLFADTLLLLLLQLLKTPKCPVKNVDTSDQLKLLFQQEVAYASQTQEHWMRFVHVMADAIGPNRNPLPADDPGLVAEREAIEAVGERVKSARMARDQATAAVFALLFGGAIGDGMTDSQSEASENAARLGV